MIVSTHVRAEGRSSGVEVQMHVYQVATFREDKAVRRQVFQTREEALEAVRLRE